MKLRPHQEDAIEQVRNSLRKGNKRVMLGAPCSFGKTIVAGKMLSEAEKLGKRGIFICDRIKLVQQSLTSFDNLGLNVGVIQGSHERTDYSKPIQIASIQTIARKTRPPEFDFAIVDEAHVAYKSLIKLMDRYSNVPFIGLSATPYTKGLGKVYQDLIVPITPEQLLDKGYLCPVDYYSGSHVSTDGLSKKKTQSGTYDYDPDQLARRTEDEKDRLTGDIIENWKKHAYGRQTIAFSPSIKHSKYMVEMFNEAGIPAFHIDGYTSDEDRLELFEAHDKGEFYILSCSQLLSTGYDSPTTSCIIDCKPTRSISTYIQIAGRIMRTAEGKDKAIYLCHSDNVHRHGFAECIVPDELDDGEKKFDEKKLTKEKKEKTAKTCPQCKMDMMGMRCACGYEVPMVEQLKTDNEILAKMEKTQSGKNNLLYSGEQKQNFLGEIYLHAHLKGKSKGWVAHTYKAKFGVFPNKIIPRLANEISPEVAGHIKHQAIKYAKGKKWGKRAVSK